MVDSMQSTDDTYNRLNALTVERSNDLVYRRLRDAIASGALEPGQRLFETRLARRLGVSRAPIREAIRVLEREGLLESVPRRGVTVVVLRQKDVREVYGLREALECAAVREAARRATPELLERLRVLIERMREATESKNLERLSAEDVAFHSAISEFADNDRLHRVWSSMLEQIRLLSRQVIGTLYADLTPVAQRHEVILQAIRLGDSDVAESVIRDHISSVADRMVAAFAQRPRPIAAELHPWIDAVSMSAGKRRGEEGLGGKGLAAEVDDVR